MTYPTSSSASDVWSLRDVYKAEAGGDWPVLPGTAVSEVFSTDLYTGNASAKTITNGIDLNVEGGMVWGKSRSIAGNHRLHDSERGSDNTLSSNSTDAEVTGNGIASFNSDGFTMDSGTNINQAFDYVSWTFRKAPKFFDVVTYTGNGAAEQAVPHNLGVAPACYVIKQTDSTGDWWFYTTVIDGSHDYLKLNATNAAANSSRTPPTSTHVYPGTATLNNSGSQYVIYMWAHNNGDGGFGPTANQDIIKCGSYTGTGSAQTLNLGFEPQWILIKQSSGANDWNIWDNMRGLIAGGTDAYLRPNLSSAEDSSGSFDFLSPTTTGVTVDPGSNGYNFVNTSGQTYIYIAIRAESA